MGVRVVVTLAVMLIAAAIGVGLWGARRWERATRDALASLHAAPAAPDTSRYREREIGELPAPVQRYFRRVLRDGQPRVARVRWEQAGRFLLRETPPAWTTFDAIEEFRVTPPAFVWLARMPMGPGLTAHVRDEYRAGEGRMRVELARVVPMVDQHGTPEMASGALVRHLAEAVWFPTALLPAAGVQWTAVDDTTARATLSDAGVTVSMDFVFGERGEVLRATTSARARTDAKGSRLLPWGGRYWNWIEQNGMRVPIEAEVAWIVDGEWRPYWIGRLGACEVEWAK